MAAEAAQVAGEVAKEGVLGSLGIQWRLFVAQLVNFGIVLFILWKWVFNPVMDALDKRQKTIAKGLEDAEASAAARLKAEEEKETAITAARKEAQSIIEEASSEAEKVRKETLEKTRAEVADLVAQGRSRLQDEQEAMIEDAKKQMADLVVASTEKVLGETVQEKEHRSLIESSVKRLIG